MFSIFKHLWVINNTKSRPKMQVYVSSFTKNHQYSRLSPKIVDKRHVLCLKNKAVPDESMAKINQVITKPRQYFEKYVRKLLEQSVCSPKRQNNIRNHWATYGNGMMCKFTQILYRCINTIVIIPNICRKVIQGHYRRRRRAVMYTQGRETIIRNKCMCAVSQAVVCSICPNLLFLG